MKKKLWVSSLILAVVSLVLWGAWWVDSRANQVKARGDSEVFSFDLPDNPNTGADIVIRCDEDVMSESSEAFAKWLSLPNATPVSLPGGAMALAKLNDVTAPASLKPAQRSVIEVLKRYSPRRVILVSHTQCLYYDTLSAWNNALSQAKEKEISDLKAAVQVLHTWFPKTEVSTYLAEEENQKLIFRKIN